MKVHLHAAQHPQRRILDRTVLGRYVNAQVALLILLCGTVSACGGYVQSHTEQGDAYFKAGKYNDAIAEYGKAIRFSANDPHILRQIGLAHFRVGQVQDAYAFLSKAELLKPGDPEVHVTLGQTYLLNRRPDEAVREAQVVLRSDSGNAGALDLLASAYLNQKDPTKAIQAYRRLAQLFPKDAQRHYALGVGLMVGQQTSEARQELEAALRLAPDHVGAITQLVNLDLLERRPDVALARVQKQMGVAGRTPKLLMLLASVQAGAGNQSGAEEAYREAIRLDSASSDARVALANFYATAGKLDQALPLVDSVLKMGNKSADAYQVRGLIMQSKGDFQAARQSYEEALKVNPGYIDAANNLAWVLSENLGDSRRAFAFAERAYQAAPNNPHVADTFGWIVYRLGDVKRAVALLAPSAEQLPSAPGIQYHLGMALLGSGDTLAARRAFTRAANSTVPFADKAAAQKALSSLK